MRDDKEHDYWLGRSIDEVRLRPVTLAWWVWAVVIGLVFAGALYAGKVNAEPFAKASSGNVTITLHNEPCKLTEHIANLPGRAVWTERGKIYEGCAAANPELGVVVLYFREDKTVAVIPISAFERVVGV